MKNKRLIKDIDYTIENGQRIWTREYLLRKGKCCRHGCRNCPWDFKRNENIRTKLRTRISSSMDSSEQNS